MNRPWQIWSIFAGCTLLVLAAMGWVSWQAILADSQRSQAEWEMQREQQVSLALWRMDTILAPLIAEEAARPHYFYDSFFSIAGSSGGKGFGGSQPQWIPSPMLLQAKNVLLNFDNTGSGQWKSPQVPAKEFGKLATDNGLTTEQIGFNRDRLGKIAQEVDLENLLAQLPEEELPQLSQSILANSQQIASAPIQASQAEQNDLSANQLADVQQQISLPQAKTNRKNEYDYGQRGSRYQGVVQKELVKQRGGNFLGNIANTSVTPPVSIATTVTEGLSRPLWVNDQLLLARRIVRDGVVGVQGSWLDWENIKRELLSEVIEQFPGADLKPLADPEDGDPARMLAGLPVELFIPYKKGLYFPSAALRWTLGLGWVAIVAALMAVAALLWGVVALSERRAAFVSSVTHELRTPLTTFRMYADMLARDMVPDAGKRHEYLETLQREAERLTHLVENVLSYARLERGRGPNACEQIAVGDLIERQQPRLAERSQQANMNFEVSLSKEVSEQTLTTDVGVVEQIFFNLVDNAAKYAVSAEDRRIEFNVQTSGQEIQFTVRDHGPGFSKAKQVRNPRPFSKTSEQAAVSAPGVGLGLALCRRLAKQLGGRLEISPGNSGAVVTLALPLDA